MEQLNVKRSSNNGDMKKYTTHASGIFLLSFKSSEGVGILAPGKIDFFQFISGVSTVLDPSRQTTSLCAYARLIVHFGRQTLNQFLNHFCVERGLHESGCIFRICLLCQLLVDFQEIMERLVRRVESEVLPLAPGGGH